MHALVDGRVVDEADNVSEQLPAAVTGLGPELAGVPLWEVVIVLGLAAGVVAVAVWRRPGARTAAVFEAESAELAVLDEIQDHDKAIGAQAHGVLTLSTVAAGAFATIVQTYGGPDLPLIFATVVTLMTCSVLAVIGLALTGEATGAAGLAGPQLRACVERNLRRTYRRTQCVRAATWSLFPCILLVVTSIAVVRN